MGDMIVLVDVEYQDGQENAWLQNTVNGGTGCLVVFVERYDG